MARLLPAMTQEKLDTQRDVVKNERRWSVDNQPYGTWWEKLPALCFPPEHPFHHSLIGSMEDLTRATLEDVAEFFRTFYTPDNAVLTIAGDFDAGSRRGALVERVLRRRSRAEPGSRRSPTWRCRRCSASGGARWSTDDVCCRASSSPSASPVFGSRRVLRRQRLRRGPRHRAAEAACIGSLVRERQLASARLGAFTYDLAKGDATCSSSTRRLAPA